MNRTFLLPDLLKNAGVSASVPANISIKGLSYNSQNTRPGDLFFAISGARSDGHNFIEEAAKKGAVAAIVEKEVKSSIPLIRVSHVPKAMAPIAHVFFGEPSHHIPVLGITGTNGKTTTAFLVEKMLAKSGILCGVLGTVHVRLGNDVQPAINTTPISIDVQGFLAKAVEKGAGAVAMEVSSHALELDRVNNVKFSVGVFTNLTQDHLDFHQTMEAYYQAKKKLFVRPENPRGVIAVDDEYGRRLYKEVPNAISYGLSPEAALRAENPVCNLSGIQFRLRFPSGKTYEVKNNLMGQHNISNCLSAAGALLAMGRSESSIVEGLNQSHAVPGRLERVEAGQKFVVVVDYAHTHDALAQVLSTLRNTKPKQLISVFGAGGDRDKTKRPRMGDVAARLSDRVFVTSDNPRTEDPLAILKDIEEGLKQSGKKNYTMIPDRASAIKEAIRSATEGDIVLIAGKGHEDYQIFGTQKIHFSDVEVARDAITS